MYLPLGLGWGVQKSIFSRTNIINPCAVGLLTQIPQLFYYKNVTWVVFPVPVSAKRMTVLCLTASSRNRVFAGKIGNFRRH